MDADKSRPARCPPAADAEREAVRRPRKLARPELGAGPQQMVRDLLYDLHEKAGRPALEVLETRVADDDRLDGSPKKDVIHRIISRGGPAALDDVRSVARTLARACGQDEYTVAARVTELMRSPERSSVPGPLLSPRSVYLAQVRQIAPPSLVGREAELAELAEFCVDEQAGAYVWWQARPWAGKSALLSTFVLHPPETLRSRVQVVAFFITARLAAQDTRQAFTPVLGEQLAALTGQQIPAVIDESLREAWLLDQLTQAAEGCRQRGRRLVLVVDGLDEDRGVTTGPHARSIAALLPGVPPAGMRVIVAGRPNPPVPDDVPDWHPLREQGIIRPLSDSPHARDLQRLGQTELKRLLKGSPVEQDLLGLLTAARGGLSSDDLHELTGAGLVEIEEVLHTVAGRTFTRRPRQWAAADGLLVYLLGHEELDAVARRYLGETRLTGYRSRLQDWADRYRRPRHGGPRWPQGTPEYLLLGYPRMLNTAGDVSRLVDLVTDPARHDWMLDLTGGDAAALAEITTCQDLVLARPEPDLEAMLRLCICRIDLADRNSHIPTGLPAVWAILGEPARAEALARSITNPQALAAVAAVIAAVDPDRAETVARSIIDPDDQARALAAVAAVIAAVDPGRAETIARTIIAPYQQAKALAAVAGAIAAVDPDRAETIARSTPYEHQRAEALAAVAGAIAAVDPDRAETIARSMPHEYQRAEALAAVAGAIAAVDPDRARHLAVQAETVLRSITEPYHLYLAGLAPVSRAIAAVDPDRAETMARSIPYESRRAEALAAVAGAIAAVDPDRARHLAVQAETVARSATLPDWRAEALTAVAGAIAVVDPDRARLLAVQVETMARCQDPTSSDRDRQARSLAEMAGAIAAAGDWDQAETIARSITDRCWQTRALAAVAGAIAAVDPDRARHLAGQAETVARSITYSGEQAEVLAAVAGAIAAAGDPDRAETIARSIPYESERAKALAAVAGAIAAVDPDRARHLAGQAETATHSITRSGQKARALAVVAGAIAAVDPDRARHLAVQAVDDARFSGNEEWKARVLAEVAGAIAAVDPGWAQQLAGQAETVARSISYSPGSTFEKARALAEVARAIAAVGDPDRAGTIAWSITEPDDQAQALAAVAGAIAAAGDPDRAGRLLGAVLAAASWRVSLSVLAEHWPQVVLRCADALSGNERSRDTPTGSDDGSDRRRPESFS
jgi:hypothetical protein